MRLTEPSQYGTRNRLNDPSIH